MAQQHLMTDNETEAESDLWSGRVCHFRLHDERYTIYKDRGEPYEHVLLKAATFYLYAPTYDTLTLDPPYYRKFKADVAAFTFAEEPLFWAECGDTPKDKLEFALKHSGARDVAYVHTLPVAEMEAYVKKAIHYRYLEKLTLIHIPPEALQQIDPNHFWLDERDIARHYF